MAEQITTGQVMGLGNGSLTVLIDGAPVPGVLYSPDVYIPQVGDVVLLARVGGMSQKIYVLQSLTPGRGAVPVIQLQGTAPSGAAQVSSWYQTGNVGGIATNPPVMVGVYTTAPAATTALVVNPIGSRTYDPVNLWRSDDAKPRQGSWGSGRNSGLWFYGANAFAGLSGKTVQAVTMTVKRDTQGGTSYGPMQLRLWLHNHVNQPVGAPVLTDGPLDAAGADPALGSIVSFSLPVSWGQALQGGTAAGVAISDDSTNTYVIVDGPDLYSTSGQLSISYV